VSTFSKEVSSQRRSAFARGTAAVLDGMKSQTTIPPDHYLVRAFGLGLQYLASGRFAAARENVELEKIPVTQFDGRSL
jgi:hypothetical protein